MQYDINTVYKGKISSYLLLLKDAKKKARRVSMFRLSVFVVAILLVYLFAINNSWEGVSISLGLSIVLFLYLVRKHIQIALKIKFYNAFISINRKEHRSLEGDFSDYSTGEEFLDREHPFAADFDVFGEASLFQFLCRSATFSGKKQLAHKLQNPEIKPKSIKETQDLIAALAPQLDWRQSFEAIGIVYEEKETDKKNILDWVKQKPLFLSKIYTILIYLIPLSSFTLLAFTIAGILAPQLFFIYLFIPWGIAGMAMKKVDFLHNQVSKTSEMLIKYSFLLKEIEKLNLSSTYFSSLQKKLITDHSSASKNIKKLSSILSALDNRLNPVSWAIFNALALWDILQIKRLENWQHKYHDAISDWFFVLAETDALSSLANYSFNHPTAILPEINEGPFNIKAKALGHPLIHPSGRVNNDFSIQLGEFTIITGANMAGKSTYLRTVGVNLILAMSGAPVCAESFSFCPISLFSSIRTDDSLHKNESYFYAELKRLQRIIEELKKGEELFIILDEILKGTNSKDKHAGSEALIKQLLTYKTGGIIATHDVSLGELALQFPQQVNTRCFEVDIQGNELIFDYKIRDGVSKNMNATLLMKKMGITI